MKPEFYVIRLGREINPDKPIIGQQVAQPVQARARDRGLRGFEPALQDPPVEVDPHFAGINGYGQEIARAELRDPVIRFTTKDIAEAYAQEQASKNPKVLYAVMEVAAVFETQEAPVIVKYFNNAGELVLNNVEGGV